MHRRDFLKKGTAAAGLAASHKAFEPLARAQQQTTSQLSPVPKRWLGKTGIELSIIALGGVAVMDTTQAFADNLVAEAFDRGINYGDAELWQCPGAAWAGPCTLSQAGFP